MATRSVGDAGGKNTVQNFVAGAVAADGEKFAVALGVAFAREAHSIGRSGGGHHVDVDAAGAQAGQRGPGKFGGAATACCGIDDGEELLHAGSVSLLNLWVRPGRWHLQFQNRGVAIHFCKGFRERVSLDLHGSGARKILVEQHNAADALVV